MATTPGASSSLLQEFNLHDIPPEFQKEGSDWFALFSPKVKRVMDVNLVHTLMHERCVCARYLVNGSLTVLLLQ